MEVSTTTYSLPCSLTIFNALLSVCLSVCSIRTGFNIFLDKYRDPKEIQEELVREKLKSTDPFKGDLDADIKWPNAHLIDPKLPQWKRREIERKRYREGIYRDMDWNELRRDPSDA